jgi:hypothetical protein
MAGSGWARQKKECKRPADQGGVEGVRHNRLRTEPETTRREQLGVAAADEAQGEEGETERERRERKARMDADIGKTEACERRRHKEQQGERDNDAVRHRQREEVGDRRERHGGGKDRKNKKVLHRLPVLSPFRKTRVRIARLR